MKLLSSYEDIKKIDEKIKKETGYEGAFVTDFKLLREYYVEDEIEVCEKVKKNNALEAFKTANNAIYFNDRSDYLSALYEVCKILNPDIKPDDIGKKYIE